MITKTLGRGAQTLSVGREALLPAYISLEGFADDEIAEVLGSPEHWMAAQAETYVSRLIEEAERIQRLLDGR